MLLIPFYVLWVDTFKKGAVSPDHYNKIKTTRKSLVEFFGIDVSLKSIDIIKYQRWINYMGIDQNRAKRTVTDKHNITKAVFDEALDSGYIYRNPARNAKIVGRDTTGEKKASLTLDEWKILRNTISKSEDCTPKYIALTMMYLGTRFQETIGLYKSDFDFVNHKVSINKAYDYKRSMKNTRTKTTGSVRMVDLTKELETIIRDYMTKLGKDKKVVSINKNSLEYIFI
ncbi:phage integrase SAM-like domain-containing protein [Candidatus Enterococcus ikei]|uniref:Phage integrase SAM-like domain-containing protein n=1 Tax=Candidatus Enterococcus ikei TaxID=2815326 RepID=A0ABS3GWE2_9ENTE|nr:phage integrase SAM-like domain-containing protein [Enterococcus sp. DIV0869a]MBO0439579.1 phage integrase SAM-like domain-containing protein [Enterococcus sp. DIV0869a]